VANPIAIATKGKGYVPFIKRACAIGSRYGLTAAKMDRALKRFVNILQGYGCGASLPITTSALVRNGPVIEKYQAQNIEFAIHGLFHIDYSQLALGEQDDHIKRARQIFDGAKIKLAGFRCPYLRWNNDTLTAVDNNDLSYDSSQALHWDVVEEYLTADYQRVLDFYRAQSANDYPALPKIINSNIVQIPYSLPDDEALIERFQLKVAEPMNELWLAILEKTYDLGELFTLGLHPERVYLCEAPLIETLHQARESSPGVWIARLDEIARWWKARTATDVRITDGEGDEVHLSVNGPDGVTILVRGVQVTTASEAWDGIYRCVKEPDFSLRAARRPFIGVSPASAHHLTQFLRQQGYIVEQAENDQSHALYLDRPEFGCEDERSLLAQIEESDFPLVRLGRWPNGARSALCVTGDIDALTLWDYGLRFLGN
jgi:peptidoglycan/xylan/chitin deacetylase (PgdA/CDA1 family)